MADDSTKCHVLDPDVSGVKSPQAILPLEFCTEKFHLNFPNRREPDGPLKHLQSCVDTKYFYLYQHNSVHLLGFDQFSVGSGNDFVWI